MAESNDMTNTASLAERLPTALFMIILGAFVFWGAIEDSKRGWTTKGPMAIQRKEHPFAFWFTILITYGVEASAFIIGVTLLTGVL